MRIELRNVDFKPEIINYFCGRKARNLNKNDKIEKTD